MNSTVLKKIILQEIENYNKDQNNLKIKDVKILLYNYNKYLRTIPLLYEKLKELEEHPIILNGQSEDIKVQKSSTFKSDLEKIEDKIENIKLRIERLVYITDKIKHGISIIQDDEYFTLIDMKYFQNMSNKDVCNALFISDSTLNRHHHRLINELKSILFL